LEVDDQDGGTWEIGALGGFTAGVQLYPWYRHRVPLWIQLGAGVGLIGEALHYAYPTKVGGELLGVLGVDLVHRAGHALWVAAELQPMVFDDHRRFLQYGIVLPIALSVGGRWY
jgi:hypothetical protein